MGALLCIGATTIIQDTTVSNGEVEDYVSDDILQTVEDTNNPTQTRVSIESGGDSIFWARNRVVLKPGFHAKTGSLFWAAVDADMDGFSDTEATQDSDGDGMFDAWETHYGLNPSSSADAASDLDSDGISNKDEFDIYFDPTAGTTSTPGSGTPITFEITSPGN